MGGVWEVRFRNLDDLLSVFTCQCVDGYDMNMIPRGSLKACTSLLFMDTLVIVDVSMEQ